MYISISIEVDPDLPAPHIPVDDPWESYWDCLKVKPIPGTSGGPPFDSDRDEWGHQLEED